MTELTAVPAGDVVLSTTLGASDEVLVDVGGVLRRASRDTVATWLAASPFSATGPVVYATVASLLAGTEAARGTGTPWQTKDGFNYVEAAPGATDHQVTTAGGVKLYVLPGVSGYSPLAFGAVGDNSADDTSELQAWINFMLLNQPTVHTLDGGGRRYKISAPLTSAAAPGTVGIYKKTIRNLWLEASASFAGTHLLDFSVHTGTLNGIRFENLSLQGAPGGANAATYLAAGAIKLSQTQGVFIHDCLMEGFNGQIIWDTNTGAGAEVYVTNNRITGGGNGTAPVGIDLAGNDNYISGNIIRECATHIRLRKGTNWIALNHLYNFTRDAVAGIVCDDANGIYIHHNYIDTVWIDLFSPQRCTIIGNHFLVPTGTDFTTLEPNRAFIECIAPSLAYVPNGLVITGNHFECAATGPVRAVRARNSGTQTFANPQGCVVRNNAFENVTETATEITRRLDITAATSGSYDFASSQFLSTGWSYGTASFQGASGGPVNRTAMSGTILTAHLGSSSTGSLIFTAFNRVPT